MQQFLQRLHIAFDLRAGIEALAGELARENEDFGGFIAAEVSLLRDVLQQKLQVYDDTLAVWGLVAVEGYDESK